MPSPLQLSVQQVDHLLPQTQCGLCGHKAGCLPYAQSILEGEDANKCIPGGQPVADDLANLLQRTKLNVEPSVWDIQEDGRPQRVKAIIREDECIGCTKCISACPVDAIIGTGKMMHTIMTDLCTGCELCLEPCPVDCIDLIPDHSPLPTLQERIAEQNDLRSRYKAHLIREQSINQHRNHARPTVKAGTSQQHLQAIIGDQFVSDEIVPTQAQQTISPQTTIELAKIRTQIKKLQKQLSVRHDQTKADQLFNLEQQLNALMDA